ncbi:hypothetical protein, partial [Bradyrhizobium sp.]|uniref:hypothetical protein n=1 Tax=Bradyrhizobium sp. TaxID=376 RepID=UPI0025C6039D
VIASASAIAVPEIVHFSMASLLTWQGPAEMAPKECDARSALPFDQSGVNGPAFSRDSLTKCAGV